MNPITAGVLGFALGCGFTIGVFVILALIAQAAQKESELPDGLEGSMGNEWYEQRDPQTPEQM